MLSIAICQQPFVHNQEQQTLLIQPLYDYRRAPLKVLGDFSPVRDWINPERFYRYVNSCEVVGFVGFAGAEGAGWFAAFCGRSDHFVDGAWFDGASSFNRDVRSYIDGKVGSFGSLAYGQATPSSCF